eukprot:CAMPEP_0117448586 /NCGR_PEP_ID=MMETSP0759-20121206/7482_1 /TAXON_ID=63605 /ORGANISM="Percolomonas cosmopolitus, Strain WS" /LENGTH=877 /DNA_ID=CAMNT_0005240987 /DNA_START=189 /DNA_END=2822 /DNA_ORIENTATION=-
MPIGPPSPPIDYTNSPPPTHPTFSMPPPTLPSISELQSRAQTPQCFSLNIQHSRSNRTRTRDTTTVHSIFQMPHSPSSEDSSHSSTNSTCDSIDIPDTITTTTTSSSSTTGTTTIMHASEQYAPQQGIMSCSTENTPIKSRPSQQKRNHHHYQQNQTSNILPTMYTGTRSIVIPISEQDRVMIPPEDRAEAHLQEKKHCYMGFDIGSSSVTAFTIKPNMKGPLQLLNGSTIDRTAIAFPAQSWDAKTNRVNLRSMLFGEEAMESQSDTLLTYWKPFHLAHSKVDFNRMCKEFQYLGHGHHLLGWRSQHGLYYKYECKLSETHTVSEEIPLWRIENEILRRLLHEAEETGVVPRGVHSAVFTMPVACNLVQRHRRLARLTDDTALREYVTQWHVLTESSAAFLGKTLDLTSEESRMVVVDLGEGTLDISTGYYTTKSGIRFDQYLGCTDVRGTQYTEVMARALWEKLDTRVVDPITRRLKVQLCKSYYSKELVQAVFDMCRSVKERLCNKRNTSTVTESTRSLLKVYDWKGNGEQGYDKVKEFVDKYPLFEFDMQQFQRGAQLLNDKLISHIDTCLKKQQWLGESAIERCDVMVLVGRPMKNPHLVHDIRKHFKESCGRIISYNVESQVAAGAAQGALLLDYDSSLVQNQLSTNVYLELARPPSDDVRTLGKTMLVPIFCTGSAIPAEFHLGTTKTHARHQEIDFPLFVGETEQSARLLCNVVAKAPKQEGHIKLKVSSTEAILVEADHGMRTKMIVHMQHVHQDIFFNPFGDERYIADEYWQQRHSTNGADYIQNEALLSDVDTNTGSSRYNKDDDDDFVPTEELECAERDVKLHRITTLTNMNRGAVRKRRSKRKRGTSTTVRTHKKQRLRNEEAT